ncbi:acyltransferase family protein [Brachybacterium epidermidis]|uniref:acyltransferase family protein n=1 Tax=Brachybacterium epidermidis TaxID=2781983 RepID=UPI00398E92A4
MRTPGFRPELHGLRGVAIGLVVVYHVWLDRVSGGVDVFLFLSAFLLTGTFLRVADRGARPRPMVYWARTFKRLLPPASVVVLASLVGVFTLLGADRWLPSLTDAAASLLQLQNWVLIQRGTDYYAADASTASVFQHFWSLSIQGQVFLVWPVLISAVILVARAVGVPVRGALALVFTVVAATSLAWSVHSTGTQQTVAYFDTLARVWEFSTGSLLALALMPQAAALGRNGTGSVGSTAVPAPGAGATCEGGAPARGRRRADRPVAVPARLSRGLLIGRVVAGWAGLVALVSCGMLVDVQGAFPGWIALWPLSAAALVLLAGSTGHLLSVDRLLSTRPARFLGDVSYGLYLVHWPLLILYLAATGKPRAAAIDGAGLVVAALALAWLLTRLVDAPVRRWGWANAKPWRSAAVAITAMLMGLAPVAGAHQHLHAEQREAQLRAVSDNPGARVLDPRFEPHPDADPDAPVLPIPALVTKDWVGGTDPCTGDLAPTGVESAALEELCRTVPAEVGEGAPVMVSVGDSRLEQASGALIPLAQREGWTMVTLWKGGCSYTPDVSVSPECDAFSRAARAYIDRVRPEAVLLSTTFLTHEERAEILPEGMSTTLEHLQASTDTVIALRALPRLPLDPLTCVQERGWDHPGCITDLPDDLAGERPDASLLPEGPSAADPPSGAVIVPLDLNPLVCPQQECRPVVGKVMVFIDAGHISGTYAASMQEAVDKQLTDSGFRW